MRVRDRSSARSRLSTLTVSCALALGASGAIAGAASAPAIRVVQRCVVDTATSAGAMTVAGSGFVPGDTVDLESTPAGASSIATVGPTGTFAASFTGPILSTSNPTARSFTLTATDEDNGATATTTFLTANLAVATNPHKAKPAMKVTYSFSGFRPGAPIYAHYLHRNEVTTTANFGRSRGACGQLKRKAKFYPGRQRFTTYKVQFDDARRYSPHSSPRFVATLRLFSP